MNKQSASIVRFLGVALGLCCLARSQSGGAPAPIDTHVHLRAFFSQGGSMVSDFPGAAAHAVDVMDQLLVDKALLMPTPFSPGNSTSPIAYDYTVLAQVTVLHPGRLEFLGGGQLLNPMIHSIASGSATSAQREEFASRAQAIADAGACGFGELTALHLSLFAGHSFQEVQPDHELLLLLAEIAEANQLPIDLHMEPVAQDMVLGPGFPPPNPQAPDVVHENLTAFSRLLDHAPGARWVWTHAGTDHLGDMTVTLLRTMLVAHDNLYLAIKVTPGAGGTIVEANRPVDLSGNLRPEWLQLISDFPDRIMLGSDQFFGSPGNTTDGSLTMPATLDLAAQLPAALAQAVSEDTVRAVYRLGCDPNPVQNYCISTPNTAGPGAVMGYQGSLSHSANSITLTANGGPTGEFGIFYYGASQDQVPVGDGVRCVGPPAFRLPVVVVDSAGLAQWPLDLTSTPLPGGLITPGTSWFFQFWYRDPLGGPAHYNFSDGLELRLCP